MTKYKIRLHERRILEDIYGKIPNNELNRLLHKGLYHKELELAVILYREALVHSIEDAKKYIAEGLVRINDNIINNSKHKVSFGDIIELDQRHTHKHNHHMPVLSSNIERHNTIRALILLDVGTCKRWWISSYKGTYSRTIRELKAERLKKYIQR